MHHCEGQGLGKVVVEKVGFSAVWWQIASNPDTSGTMCDVGLSKQKVLER